jgi:hypothetical protein
VIGDGAGWTWRLADGRWPQAKQRLDFYPAVQHLAAVGRALGGEDNAKFKTWLQPLVRQRKNQSAVKVIRQLDEALAGLLASAAVLGVAAFAGLLVFRQSCPAPGWFIGLILALVLVAGALLGWTAHLGGKVRHPEIRGPVIGSVR